MTSIIGMVVFTLLLGVVYPFAITGISQVAFPGNANGQKLYLKGRLIGSRIIGQQFATLKMHNGKVVQEKGVPLTEQDPRYFQSRPSATKPPYNAAESSFSNLGPNSTVTERAIAENIKAYLEMERPYLPTLTAAQVPVDAATASASGLDPEISQANARIQAHRIAAVRHLPLSTVDALIANYTSSRGLGFSGEPGVNVLQLNLALDRLTGGTGGTGGGD
ncbi:MAG: potassium-transporting ATPase subunit C [Solirubrobacterales bacterium]|nr:potassium-transporting ATPase subunit C [Solirubrobacterales bacterium]